MTGASETSDSANVKRNGQPLVGLREGVDRVIRCIYIVDMAIVKKLVQHGNSSALIIEKPILELLNIGPETALDIRTDGRSLIITPISEDVRKAAASVNRRHGRTLKRLSR